MKKLTFSTELAYVFGVVILALGTILCALVNGWLIGQCTRVLERRLEFRDRLRWRGFFEK